MECFPDLLVIVGGDFNCRVAALDQLDPAILYDHGSLSAERYSNDLKINPSGKRNGIL